MFGEPPRTQADLNFMLFGVPVRVHPLFWLMAAMLGPIQHSGAPEVITWILAAFLAILVHEMGHALVIRAFGSHPWIVLYGMGGLTFHDPDYASRSRGSGPLGQILISLAGPAAGFLLIAGVVLGMMVAGHRESIGFTSPWGLRPCFDLRNPRLGDFFDYISLICIFWGLVNLLPIYPLDGGKIARELLLLVSPRNGVRQSLVLSMLAAGAMAVIAATQWHAWFTAMLFGYLAYSSYITLQIYRGRNPW